MSPSEGILSRAVRFHGLLGLAAATLAGGCGTEPLVPAAITVSPNAVTLLRVDETIQLGATVQDPDGRTILDASVMWMSGDESVATVGATTGLVTAVGPGEATVRAAVDGLEASSIVTVDLQRGALVSIYEALGGPGWDDSRFWGTDEPIGSWWGVTTDSAGNVVELSLTYNRLTGRIPAEIRLLETLEHLTLRDNALSGPIPPELGDLRKLRTLFLDRNALTSPLPPALADLPELEDLGLGWNELTGPIPPELAGLRQLRYLRHVQERPDRFDSARTRQPSQPRVTTPGSQRTDRSNPARTRRSWRNSIC